MQKQSFGLGLFSLTALRRTADLQGMLSAKTADLAPVVPVIALVELNDSNQPEPDFQMSTSALQRLLSVMLERSGSGFLNS